MTENIENLKGILNNLNTMAKLEDLIKESSREFHKKFVLTDGKEADSVSITYEE